MSVQLVAPAAVIQGKSFPSPLSSFQDARRNDLAAVKNTKFRCSNLPSPSLLIKLYEPSEPQFSASAVDVLLIYLLTYSMEQSPS